MREIRKCDQIKSIKPIDIIGKNCYDGNVEFKQLKERGWKQ